MRELNRITEVSAVDYGVNRFVLAKSAHELNRCNFKVSFDAPKVWTSSLKWVSYGLASEEGS